MDSVARKVAALRRLTIANGASSAEAAEAQRLADKLAAGIQEPPPARLNVDVFAHIRARQGLAPEPPDRVQALFSAALIVRNALIALVIIATAVWVFVDLYDPTESSDYVQGATGPSPHLPSAQDPRANLIR